MCLWLRTDQAVPLFDTIAANAWTVALLDWFAHVYEEQPKPGQVLVMAAHTLVTPQVPDGYLWLVRRREVVHEAYLGRIPFGRGRG